MKCFYHSADLDGHCSGAIVKYFNPECEMIGINYGDDFPWEKIDQNEVVYMVDFSLQPFNGMVKLALRCNLVWIDHHVSAIEDSVGHTFGGIQRDGIGACQLVWEYFAGIGAVPYAVQLLAQYDVFDHTKPETLPFQYAMRFENTFPENSGELWPDLFNNGELVFNRIKRGKTILKYISEDNRKYCSACSFSTKIDGLKCIAVNKMLTNSKVFDSVWNNEKYDAMMTFGWRKGRWTVSLYTDKSGIDVSKIAKARGGGGHKQAAGFQCDELPFELRIQK